MEQAFQFLKRFEKYSKNVDLIMAFAMIGILGVMLVPLPAFMLDLALTISLTTSILILLVALYTTKALDFSVFPSLLLITTLFRLSLNVATTRLVLSQGHTGESAAGAIIHAFGSFVVGDNYVIGFVVFVILVIINFVVITKGSGRVAEVAARFTLDAMPGKQMAIDADLNSGLINEDQARKRRKEIEQEADFYGAMDGASKFVRGDAIAGIIITIVNIVGGLAIGVIQHGLDISTAAQFYTKLTIGDGLVSQIPALIISTAAGMIVTRSGSEKDMGTEVVGQLFLKPRALYISGGIMGILGIVGLPTVPFFVVGGSLAGVGWMISRFKEESQENERKAATEIAAKPEKEKIENLLPLDLVELEVGYGLINIVESDQSGDLLERIVSIRKQFALDLGIIVPSIHIRDNLQLEPGEYRLMIKGSKVGGGTLRPEYLLAMDPGNTVAHVDGIPTKEPAFGLDALWIGRVQKEEAEMAGYTVVDLSTVMATHITEIIRTHAHELLGRQEASVLVENFKKQYPKVVEELIPDPLPLGTVVKVLQNLLREQVSIRDLLTIFETLADEAYRTKEPEMLTEQVRRALARGITNRYKNDDGRVAVLSLDPRLEELIANSLLQTEQGVQLVMDPRVAHGMIEGIASSIEHHPEIAGQPILLTSPTARRHIFKLTHRFIPQLIVLSHNELTADAHIQSVGAVEIANAVKKFEAKSMKEALQMVKQELGPDAVILAARDNRKSFGIGGQASVEITAAVSESTLQKKKFAESRLPQQQRDQFAAAGARQQRQMIEKMVEKRVRRNEEEQQASVRKPITKTSYIDIPDDVEESPRRRTAFSSATGRSVDELLNDFDQDLLTPEEFAQAELVARARTQNARTNVRSAAQAARAQIAAQAQDVPMKHASGDETGGGIAEGAMARIRNAARDAWKNNPFAEETPRAVPSRQAVHAVPAPAKPSAAYSRGTTVQAAAAVAATQRPATNLYSTSAPQRPTPNMNTNVNMNANVRTSNVSGGGLELVEDYDQFRPVEIGKIGAPASQPQPNEVAKLQGEIKRLEQMLEGFQKVPQTFATLHPGADYGIGYDYSFMFQKLSESGVATDLVVEILKAAEKEIDPVQAKKKPIIDAWVARWFLNNTKTVPAAPSTAGRLHLFVGGTGSGKTTSLIKMAAQLVVKEKKTVAILSTDSTKVGAVDQMKIYCQILNVPFAVIRNKQDWEWVFSQLRNIDHILVDFPGSNLREIDEIHHLKSLLPPEGFAPITHLCVAATSKDGDADELARRFKVAEPNDLIFTNLDQCVQHGIIYNMQRRTGLPLHSFGIGNRIPEDFEAASKERVLDLIFKLTKLRRETT